MSIRARFCLVFALAAGGCGPAPAPVEPASARLRSSFEAVSVGNLLARAPFTVFFFFKADCPCVTAHDGRLRALHERVSQKGVQFIAVDSEVGATPERAAGEARRRGYPFTVLVDEGGVFADAVGAEFATYTAIFDRDGRVRYGGGFDSNRAQLHDDAKLYVRDALEDLLAGREPRVRSGETLGCALEKD